MVFCCLCQKYHVGLLKRITMKNLYLLILLGLLGGCMESTTYRKMPEHIAAYISFAPGTTWIYFDSLNNRHDTLKLTSVTSVMNEVEKNTYNEIVTQDFTLYHNGQTLTKSISIASEDENNFRLSSYMLDFSDGASSICIGKNIFDNWENNWMVQDYSDSVMVINDTEYQGSKIISYFDPGNPSSRAIFVWVKDYGVVRSEISNCYIGANQVLKLVSLQ